MSTTPAMPAMPAMPATPEVTSMNPSSASDAPPPSSALPAPITPRRLSFPSRLALQPSTRGPLSPVLDPTLGYSVARRPRLDFARACTSLHHSTLAESSPDSSPLQSQNTCPIPRNNKALESPIATHHASSHASSLGSTSVLDYAPSGDDLNSSSDDESIDLDIDIAPVADQNASAATLSLRDHQKARLGARGSRKHSSASSNSGNSNSTFNTPPPTTPPILTLPPSFAGYQLDKPRRDILDVEDRIDPIRRPVSRRGSLLPKTKNFQRIKAALFEESSPIEVEVKREAEITRQIREDEEDPSPPPPFEMHHQPSIDSEISDIQEEESMGSSGDGMSQGSSATKGIGISFSKQAQRHGGFWFGDQMDGIGGSPPTFPGTRAGSDGDIVMNSDSTVTSPVVPDIRRAKRRRTQDERFEPACFKRRAVSPGLSHSPILASSPQSTSNGTGKRLNFQGMSDTNEGLMKMSLQ